MPAPFWCAPLRPSRLRPTSLADSCENDHANLGRRLELGDREAVRQPPRRHAIVVRQLEENGRLEYVLGVGKGQDRTTGTDSRRRTTSPSGSRGGVHSLPCAACCGARHAKLCHEDDPVRRVQRRERSLVELMLAVEHREQEFCAGAG